MHQQYVSYWDLCEGNAGVCHIPEHTVVPPRTEREGEEREGEEQDGDKLMEKEENESWT
jgi:hypothetical protein